MIGALAREVRDGDSAACGTLSPMPAAALWLAKETQAPKAEVFVAGSSDWPFEEHVAGVFRPGPGRTAERLLPERRPDRRPGEHQPDGSGRLPVSPRSGCPARPGPPSWPMWWSGWCCSRPPTKARGLVPQLDVITAPGFTPTLSLRQRPGRVTRLITPKCVFTFEPPRGTAAGKPPSRGDGWRKCGSSPALSSAPRPPGAGNPGFKCR